MEIILIHGQSHSPLSMSLLGTRLRAAGYSTHYFGYMVIWETFDNITQQFVEFIKKNMDNRPYAIVGHSLGGIITRAALPHLTDTLPEYLFMLGTPNKASSAAKILRLFPFYHFMTGDSGLKLSQSSFYETLPLPNVPTTVIAGINGWNGLYSPFDATPNDTVLSIHDTDLGEGVELLTVPAMHAFIMNSPQVVDVISERLEKVKERRNGSFQHAIRPPG